MERAVTEAAGKSPVKTQPEPTPERTVPQATSLNGALKGVSSSLLEKVNTFYVSVLYFDC